MRRSVLLLGLLLAGAGVLLLGAPSARAQSAPPEPVPDGRVMAFNVALTGTFAVARSWTTEPHVSASAVEGLRDA